MKLGLSRLYELQPDPYDCSQKNNLRVCLFADVKNSAELRDGLRGGRFEAALVRPELILETFIVLAAANRALHQAAHNRLSTRSLHAELIYSLSPNRNISDSLIKFGIEECSANILVCIFDDESGSKLVNLSKFIDGKAVELDKLGAIRDLALIKKVYHVHEPEYNHETFSDEIITRIITKDYV